MTQSSADSKTALFRDALAGDSRSSLQKALTEIGEK
jgi:hypothetical protein